MRGKLILNLNSHALCETDFFKKYAFLWQWAFNYGFDSGIYYFKIETGCIIVY